MIIENDFVNEYYYMRHPDGAYASIAESKESQGYSDEKGELIENPEMSFYHFSKHSEIKDEVRDYVYANGNAVVSQKVYDAIAPLNINGIQLLPVIIQGTKSNIESYYYIHIINNYMVLDLEKSICEWDDFLEVANPIERETYILFDRK